ncbi:MAG: Na+/H+ antiporter subunit E [Arachnia sp.]
MRIGFAISYWWFITQQIFAGAYNVLRAAISPARVDSPCIVAYRMGCESDVEISLFASSITITPGTLVVGIAAASPESPPTAYVHSLFDNDRERVIEGLADMEARLLRALRKGAAS